MYGYFERSYRSYLIIYESVLEVLEVVILDNGFIFKGLDLMLASTGSEGGVSLSQVLFFYFGKGLFLDRQLREELGYFFYIQVLFVVFFVGGVGNIFWFLVNFGIVLNYGKFQ